MPVVKCWRGLVDAFRNREAEIEIGLACVKQVSAGFEIGVSGPVPSIRLIAIREGVDDFEVFNALQHYAEQGDRDALEILDIVRSLVIVPNRGGMLSTSFMPDPTAVCNARVAAGEILDRLLNK